MTDPIRRVFAVVNLRPTTPEQNALLLALLTLTLTHCGQRPRCGDPATHISGRRTGPGPTARGPLVSGVPGAPAVRGGRGDRVGRRVGCG